MFKTKIFKVAYAIVMAEGWDPGATIVASSLGTRSWRNHNPGNIRLSIFQSGQKDGFAIFDNDIVGFFAIIHQLTLYAAGGSANVKPTDSLGFAMAKYSGTTIGSPQWNTYIAIVEKISGVSRNDQIKSILQN